MALVDWEAVVLDLEEYVTSRNSHGQRDLLAKLAELRSQHKQVEGLPEKALRLYGDDLVEAVTRRPTDEDYEESVAMAAGSPHRRGSIASPEGGKNGQRNTAQT